MENAIEAVNLTKYFGDTLAVDHINFAVEKDEIFGFLGPNGARKTFYSTLLGKTFGGFLFSLAIAIITLGMWLHRKFRE